MKTMQEDEVTNENPLCPRCGKEAHWDWQERHQHKGDEGVLFTERALACSMNCGWQGGSAWFPWPGTEGRFRPTNLVQEGEAPRIEDTVPMSCGQSSP